MAQTLETIIAINATVGNGFSAVGSTLTQLGSMVNGLSQELINFGKDSVNIYREYEKSMKDAEVALSTTYGRGTKELSSVMAQLDASATEWAATTIFHTNDVANAISEMAHAGWDGEKILSAMPAAMELAQAGSLDLSEAVNYIVKSTNSLGIDSVDDIGNFIDIWAFAANSSASTIGEFGDAMLRMGSTMRFASNTEELMTLIAVTANAGQTGSEAGTLIRNSMMRLVAPTKKAKEAMAELGATSDEAAVLMNDSALAAANARLEATGFSAFDEKKGELKCVLDIYRELYLSLGEVAGGFDNIEKNQDALEILRLQALGILLRLTVLVLVVQHRLDLRQAVHQRSDLFAAEPLDVRYSILRILDDVVQERRRNRFVSETDIADDNLRHGNGMQDIRLAGTAAYILVRFIGKVERLLNDVQFGGTRAAFPGHLFQFGIFPGNDFVIFCCKLGETHSYSFWAGMASGRSVPSPIT